MKLIYYGSTASTDSDFPLLRQFEKDGIDYVAYYVLAEWTKQKGLISAKDILHKDVILKASEVPAFKKYSGYLNLDKIYIVNLYHHKMNQYKCWLAWFKVLKHMRAQKADVFHAMWPLAKVEKMLYFLNCKKMLTVHDPFPHSSQKSKYDEFSRKLAFKLNKKFVLLNSIQKEEFCSTYKINEDHILINKFGEFDYLRYIKSDEKLIEGKYILFFGQIQSHKGVDILLNAMLKIHDKHPDVNLVIAGKGKFHFDITPFEGLDYIKIINRYIDVSELASLLQDCLFAVCPYLDATQSGVVQTAFSANVPLIVTNVGALPEVVKDGVTGQVVPPKDVNALADAMTKLLDNPNLLQQYRENIDKIWRPDMTWDSIAKNYIECYNELAK